MARGRKPSVHDFSSFFTDRLKHLEPDDELIWVSSTVPVRALAASYPLGIFPWPGDEPHLFPWLTPATRGVLPLDNFHLGRSTRRYLRKADYRVTFDQAFDRIIHACHHAHAPHSWIHPRMRAAYRAAHRAGIAHSVEVWDGNELVGGLYGIDNGSFFSGESMFHLKPHAGKAAVEALVHQCQTRGHDLLDIQQLTPHMEDMGAEEWTRQTFQDAIAHSTGPQLRFE